MIWHVGLLYRVVDLLELLAKEPISNQFLYDNFFNYHGVDTQSLVNIATEGNWVCVNPEGNLEVTDAGTQLLACRDSAEQLRVQIRVLIDVLSPPWAALVVQGRKGFAQYAPREVVQCFREAGILDSTDIDTIMWWDGLVARHRQKGEISRVLIGRKGERLSYECELTRTKKAPHWIALEFDGAGYDLISQLSAENAERLLIEVKTSTKPWGEATFHITRNEWEVISGSKHAVIHLWSLAREPQEQAVISPSELQLHIPSNQGDGEWESTECPFSVFSAGAGLEP